MVSPLVIAGIVFVLAIFVIIALYLGGVFNSAPAADAKKPEAGAAEAGATGAGVAEAGATGVGVGVGAGTGTGEGSAGAGTPGAGTPGAGSGSAGTPTPAANAPGMKGPPGSAAGNISVLHDTPCTTPMAGYEDPYASKWLYDVRGNCTTIQNCKNPYTVSGNKCITQKALIDQLSGANKEFAAYDPRIQKYIVMNDIPAEQDEALKNVPMSHWPGAALYLASLYFDPKGKPKKDEVWIKSFKKLMPTLTDRLAELKGETAKRGKGVQDMVLKANKAAIDEKEKKELALLESQAKSLDNKSSVDVPFPVINVNTNNSGIYSKNGKRELSMNNNGGVSSIGPVGGPISRYIFDFNRVMAAGFRPAMSLNQFSFWLKPDGRIVTKKYGAAAGDPEIPAMLSSKAPSGKPPFMIFVDDNTGEVMVSDSTIGSTAVPVQFN